MCLRGVQRPSGREVLRYTDTIRGKILISLIDSFIDFLNGMQPNGVEENLGIGKLSDFEAQKLKEVKQLRFSIKPKALDCVICFSSYLNCRRTLQKGKPLSSSRRRYVDYLSLILVCWCGCASVRGCPCLIYFVTFPPLNSTQSAALPYSFAFGQFPHTNAQPVRSWRPEKNQDFYREQT